MVGRLKSPHCLPEGKIIKGYFKVKIRARHL